jgi:hypothetical protein
VNFCSAVRIGYDAFTGCRILSSITINSRHLATLAGSNAFASTPYKGYSAYYSGTPYIYVPNPLLESYKTATNWVYFSSFFSGFSTDWINITISDDMMLVSIDGSWPETPDNGMTWAQFVDSYTGTWPNYFIDEISGCVCVDDLPYALSRDKAGTDFVAGYDLIEDGATYYIRDCTGVELPPI